MSANLRNEPEKQLKGQCFERILPSDVKKIKPVIEEALNFIIVNLVSVSPENLYDFKLSCSELLYNAVIHGNKQDADKFVRFYVKIETKAQICTIETTISDEGKGFDYNKLLNSFTQERNGRCLDEHGRGVLLAYSLADRMEFNKNGSEIVCYKRIVDYE